MMTRIGWGLSVVLAAATTCLPAGAGAQTPDWLFPDRSLLPGLMAGPRDPATQAQLVYDWESPTAFGPGVAGEVSIAGAAAVARLAGADATDALVLGLEGAAFARFSFQVVTRELVNTDWIFAVPLVWRRGEDWFRLRYFHTSSHLGDEYQRRFGPSSVNFSRDGADLTAYVRPAAARVRPLGLAVYGVVYWSVHSHPEERALWEGRAGLELDPGRGAPWRPFLTLDVHAEECAGWDPRWTLQAGIWLPGMGGRPVRLAVQAFEGPSPLGQFRDRTEGRVGVGVFWQP
jgi:hypothetical protein